MINYEPKIVLALAHILEKLKFLVTRYAMKAMYAAAKVVTTLVKNTLLDSEEKKSTIRYPLIKITRAATSHDAVYIAEAPNFSTFSFVKEHMHEFNIS